MSDESSIEKIKKLEGKKKSGAIIKLLAQYGREAPRHIGAYVKAMKDAIR